MRGRGRNTPHRRRKAKSSRRSDSAPIHSAELEDSAGRQDVEVSSDSEAEPAATGGPAEQERRTGPVPRVCVGYFYLSCRKGGAKSGSHAMSSK